MHTVPIGTTLLVLARQRFEALCNDDLELGVRIMHNLAQFIIIAVALAELAIPMNRRSNPVIRYSLVYFSCGPAEAGTPVRSEEPTYRAAGVG